MEDTLVCLQTRELVETLEEMESCWSDLPSDLLGVISSKVFFLDRCKFKLVCKSWNLTSPIPQPLPSSPVESPYFNSPCLIYFNWGNNSWKLFHSLYNQFYDLDFEELMDAEILFSRYGWLLMSRRLDEDELITLFFFNPFTKKKIELPSTSSSFISACFTSPPTSPDCIIVGVFLASSICTIDFGLFKIGEREWKLESFNADGYFIISSCPPLYCNGVYYCLDGKSKKIYVFDPMEEDNRRWIRYNKYIETSTEDQEEEEEEEEEKENDEDDEDEGDEDEEEEENEEDDEDEGDEDEEDEEEESEEDDEDGDEEEEEVHECYMAEVEGDIWGVFIIEDERRVSVKKLDASEMCWVELETLGNKCLYVSSNGSFAETCIVDGMTNIIYFNKFHGKSGIFYSLKSGMYHSVVGDFASKEGYRLAEVDFGTWIKPTI